MLLHHASHESGGFKNACARVHVYPLKQQTDFAQRIYLHFHKRSNRVVMLRAILTAHDIVIWNRGRQLGCSYNDGTLHLLTAGFHKIAFRDTCTCTGVIMHSLLQKLMFWTCFHWFTCSVAYRWWRDVRVVATWWRHRSRAVRWLWSDRRSATISTRRNNWRQSSE